MTHTGPSAAGYAGAMFKIGALLLGVLLCTGCAQRRAPDRLGAGAADYGVAIVVVGAGARRVGRRRQRSPWWRTAAGRWSTPSPPRKPSRP